MTDPEVGTVVVDTFNNAVGVVTTSANGLTRLQYPNGCAWTAYTSNLRPPVAVEQRRFEAAQQMWGGSAPQ